MSTHTTHLLRISRPNRSGRPIEQVASNPLSPPPSNARALEALSRACAIGLMIPPSLLGRSARQDVR